VFTALADVLMGYLLTHEAFELTGTCVALGAASCCLYLAGMVLNDVFDLPIDAIERPKRPLPSEAIALGTAQSLGWGLLGTGWLLGCGVAVANGSLTTAVVASLLAMMIVLYDASAKHTPLGPVAMGSCRTLNVLLGMSTAEAAWPRAYWVIAIGVGVYVAGITWFARRETTRSGRGALTAGLVVMLAGLAMLAFAPKALAPLEMAGVPFGTVEPLRFARELGTNWYLLWLLLGASIGLRAVLAIMEPEPKTVQTAIKHALSSIIVLDAALVFAAQGHFAALLVLVLLVPMTLVGRWIYST
jgi:4-hydroxybenzoate polyprenyltransferase